MYLYGGFAGDVSHQEVHGNVLAVHVSVHPVLDVSRHLVSVQIVEVLEKKTKQEITGCHIKSLKKRYLQTLSEEYVGGTTALEFSLNLSECVRFKKKGDNLALPLTLCSSITAISTYPKQRSFIYLIYTY